MARLCAGTLEGELVLLDASLEVVGRFGRQPFPAVSLEQSGNLLLAATGRTARMVDWTRPGSEAVRSFEGHTLAVTSAEFGVEERWIFTASEDKTVKIWDFRCSGQQMSLPPVVGCAPILAATLHGNGAEIVFGDMDGKVSVWDLTANRVRPLLQLRDAVTALAVDQCGCSQTGAAADEALLLLGLCDGGVFVTAHSDVVTSESSALSSAGESVRPFFASSTHALVDLADLADLSVESDMRHTEVVSRCRVSPGSSDHGRTFLTCSLAGTVSCVVDDDRKSSLFHFAHPEAGAMDVVRLASGEVVCGFLDGFLVLSSRGERKSAVLPSGVCSLVGLH